MRQVASKKFLGRALAVCLVVVAHAFLLNLGHPATVALGFAYARVRRRSGGRRGAALVSDDGLSGRAFPPRRTGVW